jgi:hypothetical protein
MFRALESKSNKIQFSITLQLFGKGSRTVHRQTVHRQDSSPTPSSPTVGSPTGQEF